MRLSQLVTAIHGELAVGEDRDISSIAYDSRRALPGSLFVAVRGGVNDGHNFIEQAIAGGATAVVCEERALDISGAIAQVYVEDSRLALALAAERFYDGPSTKLQLIGVTGTNGKTTTAYLLESIFRAAGKRTGLIGTIEYRIDGRRLQAERTTPESLDLQKTLAEMVSAGVEVAIMEVSSHAIALRRIDGCSFAARVFTNLSQDHLDFHQTLDNYYTAKARLFTDEKLALGPAVINVDDEHGARLAEEALGPVVTYGNSSAAYRLNKIEYIDGIRFEMEGPSGTVRIEGSLTGRFNVSNITAAAVVALTLGVPPDAVTAGIKSLPGVPGRFEAIACGQDFRVIVDYAHTPDGLSKVLKAARELVPDGRVITVFGCGGDRDKSKRPQMGKIAAELSDITVVTSDNPRNEPPGGIIEQILEGINGARLRATQVVAERAKAISLALAQAGPGDIVVIAGKGHEDYQIIGERTLPFDDRHVARKVLEELISGTG